MRYLVGVFICIAIIAGVVVSLDLRHNTEVLVFSPPNLVRNLWESYKKSYVADGGRTVDPDRDNITTSEGQSYTMLRAVWVDDKPVFDSAWEWTMGNLRKENGLFSWVYGRRANGTDGILTELGGLNAASDADTDIAVALLFAYGRWGDSRYLEEANTIIQNIWENEVVVMGDIPYLAANDIEKGNVESPVVLINPSYIAPYAYRMFAVMDRTHPWEKLVDSSYDFINETLESPLDRPRTANIPPDWVFINRETGALQRTQVPGLASDYSYDALRLPWRIALDWQWFRDPRAIDVLTRMGFFRSEWENSERLAVQYGHDGSVLNNDEALAMYGGSLGYFIAVAPEEAESIVRNKILYWYNPDIDTWRTKLGYYNDNWAWFGLALYYGLLPNLAPQA